MTHCHSKQFDSFCELTSYLGSQMVNMLFDFRFICLIAMKSLLFTNDLADHRYSSRTYSIDPSSKNIIKLNYLQS